MNDSNIVSLGQVEENIAAWSTPIFSFTTHKDAYEWIGGVLDRFLYFEKGRTKKEKNSIRRYIKRYTAYSKSQITRLVKEKKKTGTLTYGKGKKRHQFKKIYTEKDIELLAEADNVYRRMSGTAMRSVFRDEYVLYKKKDYERLSHLSHGHLYRLRGTSRYGEHAVTIGRTMAVSSSIGIRKRPEPNGKPGYIRADTVHQGDRDKEKGVYQSIWLMKSLNGKSWAVSKESVNIFCYHSLKICFLDSRLRFSDFIRTMAENTSTTRWRRCSERCSPIRPNPDHGEPMTMPWWKLKMERLSGSIWAMCISKRDMPEV